MLGFRKDAGPKPGIGTPETRAPRMSRRKAPDKSDHPTLFDSWIYSEAIEELTARDRSLDEVVRQYGPPPLWRRDPGFATLVHIILEQQVSLASARSTYDKLLGSVR